MEAFFSGRSPDTGDGATAGQSVGANKLHKEPQQGPRKGAFCVGSRRGRDSNPRTASSGTINGFGDRRNRPLCQPSTELHGCSSCVILAVVVDHCPERSGKFFAVRCSVFPLRSWGSRMTGISRRLVVVVVKGSATARCGNHLIASATDDILHI